jgi:hypothetical protein
MRHLPTTGDMVTKMVRVQQLPLVHFSTNLNLGTEHPSMIKPLFLLSNVSPSTATTPPLTNVFNADENESVPNMARGKLPALLPSDMARHFTSLLV